MKKYKYLKGEDILFNLKRIDIYSREGYSSLSCVGPTAFYFKDETKHGYVDDPNLTGTIKVLDVKKSKGDYVLKIKFKKKSYDL